MNDQEKRWEVGVANGDVLTVMAEKFDQYYNGVIFKNGDDFVCFIPYHKLLYVKRVGDTHE